MSPNSDKPGSEEIPVDLSPLEKELLGDAVAGKHVRWSVIKHIVVHNGDLRLWLEALVKATKDV